MNSQNRIVNLLMIARKAGKLMLGFDMVSEALKTGKAAAVIFGKNEKGSIVSDEAY